MPDDILDDGADPDTLAVRARHAGIEQAELPFPETDPATAHARIVARRAELQQALKHGLDEAIDFTDDTEAAQIAEDLAEAGVDDLPHIHNWAPVIGSAITVAGQVYVTYVCGCGASKVDRARG